MKGRNAGGCPSVAVSSTCTYMYAHINVYTHVTYTDGFLGIYVNKLQPISKRQH